MKFKKLFLTILSFCIISCLSACSGDDNSSSSSISETEITESSAAEESSDTEEASENTIETDNEDTEKTESTGESSSSQDLLENIMEEYDREHPEETIISILETGLASFGDELNVEYDEKESNYIVSLWQEGFEEILETEDGKAHVSNLVTALESSLESTLDQIKLFDNDANLTFNLISDKDHDNILFSFYNGKLQDGSALE